MIIMMFSQVHIWSPSHRLRRGVHEASARWAICSPRNFASVYARSERGRGGIDQRVHRSNGVWHRGGWRHIARNNALRRRSRRRAHRAPRLRVRRAPRERRACGAAEAVRFPDACNGVWRCNHRASQESWSCMEGGAFFASGW